MSPGLPWVCSLCIRSVRRTTSRCWRRIGEVMSSSRLSHSRVGFTLIEVLVVGAIISLLCAVLLPSLARSRRQSKNVLCRANLSEWGKIWGMYLQTNRDSFTAGIFTVGNSFDRGEWITPLRSFYYTKTNILRCPLATQRLPGHDEGGPYNTYYMPLGGNNSKGGGEEPSYGLNCWVYNPPPSVSDIQFRKTENNWRYAGRVPRPSRVPLFADTMWRGGGPSEGGTAGNPPPRNGAWGGTVCEMWHFCIDRHEGATNHLFVDSSVRRVDLKELWKLKWHRTFDTGGGWTLARGIRSVDWPVWMRGFKSY